MRPMSSVSLTLESYAEIRAEMESGRLRDEVLARAGLTVDLWTDAQRAWLERMGAELERGRFELTNRYTRAFLERQRALQEDEREAAARAAAIQAAQPLPSQPAIAAPASDGALEEAPPPSVDGDTVTTALRPPPLNPPARWETGAFADPMDDEACVEQTAAPALFRPAILPFRQDGPAIAPAAAYHEQPGLMLQQAAGGDGHWNVDETSFAPLLPAVPTLPFRPAEASPEQGSAQAGEAVPPDDDDEEVRTSLVPLVPRGPALPFGPSRSEELTTSALLEGAAGPVLPFLAPAEDQRVSSLLSSPAERRAAPGPPPAVADEPIEAVFPLALYASLCAELTVFPEIAESIFRRYGLESPERRAAVDATWKERLHHDAEQYAAWEEMYRRYHTYWTERGGSPV